MKPSDGIGEAAESSTKVKIDSPARSPLETQWRAICPKTAAQRGQTDRDSNCSDLLAVAFVCAMVAGCMALFVADLDLIAGGVAAAVGWLGGMFFANN